MIWEVTINYQKNSSRTECILILLTFFDNDKALILQREIWCFSSIRLKVDHEQAE